ncbi:MAG: hypothetical protein H6672_07270 [Anaerolineaceae bacterium]|nr:hypothetical protein [Anaerolineaceae bacterium]
MSDPTMLNKQRDLSLILSAKAEVLLQRGDAGWQIPFTSNPFHFWQSVEWVNKAVQEAFGLHVITLRCVRVEFDEAAQQRECLYLQQHLGGAIPSDMAWFSANVLPDGLAPALREEIVGWLATLDDPAQPGWYRLDGYNALVQAVGVVDHLEQLRSWERSSVWRLVQHGETRYLKIAPTMFAHEAPLTRWLAGRFPQHFPHVLDDNMLLMADYGEIGLAARPDPALWARTMVKMAEIQRDLISETTTLENMGVPVRPLSWIRERANFLLTDATYRIGDHTIRSGEAARLRASVPTLLRLLDDIEALDIPLTLEHGDLWSGQIMMHGRNLIFTDWSDATITHPFFSLEFFNAELANDLPDHPDAAEQIASAYLQMWTAYAPLERLQAVYRRAVRAVSPLYSALRYTHDILPHMAQRWEMHNMVPYYLRHVLRALADDPQLSDY